MKKYPFSLAEDNIGNQRNNPNNPERPTKGDPNQEPEKQAKAKLIFLTSTH